MSEILAELPIAADVKDALLGTQGSMRRVLDLIVMYEQGKWEAVAEGTAALKLDNSKILPNYLTAIKWANDFSRVET
jgi:EAL and modified HD-GYP domain-containing signal transduction protein